MLDSLRPLAACGIAAMLLLTGCGPVSDGDADERGHVDDHDDHDEHDHDEHEHDGHDHDGHDHGGHEHDGHDHDGHDHGDGREIGSVTIAGTTMTVEVGGAFEPGAILHVDLEITDGAAPAAIRLWVGDASGAGALKSKAFGSGSNYHGDAEMPAAPGENDALWIEVETMTGERIAASVALD